MTTQNMPVLALRGLTAFPGQTLSFDAEREISILALENAMEGDRELLLVTQREIGVQDPQEEDLYEIGTVCRIFQIVKTSDTGVRVIAGGLHRAALRRLWQTKPFLQANVELLEDQSWRASDRTEALTRRTYALFGQYQELVGNLSDQLVASVLDIRDPGLLADTIAANINLRHQDRQRVLQELHPARRLLVMNEILVHEVDIAVLESDIDQKVRQRVGQVQRDMVLREQLHVLQHELGEDGDDELYEYEEKINRCRAGDEVREKLMKELHRLSKQPFGSAEGAVIRNYLDVCLDVPWGVETHDRADVEQARKILDKDHYGLDKVKERILEFIAVRQLNPQAKGKILCLVGPPGVGKTSIALSVAKAMHRKLSRLSLGGVRDEADIRGHRKTYIGAMPGRIIDAVIRSGSMNPLLVLDEIDKLSGDYRGDPASALLEVLDPEQNKTFNDHYLDIDYDLSKVFFITTANSLHNIPAPLQDRMEIIELSSYLEVEKKHIARDFLLPRQIKEHGLKPGNISLPEETLTEVIRSYTREAGVRSLEREIGALCRKTAIKLVEEDNLDQCVTITPEDLETYLGVKKYRMDENEKSPKVGVVNGLAYTGVGGVLLNVETVIMPGKGNVATTGKIGEVMSESAKAALSYVRSRAAALGLKPDFHSEIDIHTHFPEGATPKDGPSAGTAITTSLVSALLGIPVRHDVAMTGEVTLRGRVLPIGGLREKLLAASRAEMATVIIPRDNAKDLKEVPDEILQTLRIELVDHVDEVLPIALDAPEDAIWDKSDCPSLIESLRRHHEPAVTTAQ